MIITRTTATAIDNILINNFFSTTFESGIIETDISDHFPVFLIVKNIEINRTQPKLTVTKRDFSKQTLELLNISLNDESWRNVYDSTDTNTSFDNFLSTYLKHFNTNCPLKTITVKQKCLVNPWMTPNLVKCSKRKQSLYNKFLKNKTSVNENIYKEYKCFYQRLLIVSKKNYYANKLNLYKGNLKKTWSIINDITGRTKRTEALPNCINVNNELFRNSKNICKEFNKYFVNVGSNLASKIISPDVSYESYLNGTNNTVLDYEELTYAELNKAVSQLKKKNSSGYDGINSNVIISSFDKIRKPLFHILKLSFENGIFPDSLKKAKVHPVFKKGSTTIVSNYRPISLLTSFSKIFERVFYNRIYKYIFSNNILYSKQFGFQNCCSAEHAIIELSQSISQNFDKNMFTIGIFLDLSKAFDTVDHDILLSKLSYYGIKGKYNNWIKSYLSNRTQFVIDEKSGLLSITCGVPQGSILGPLLFLIYVNDLCKASNRLNCIMFADDTNLFLSHKDVKQLFSSMNVELEKISNWFKANKLSLNTDNTKFTLFHKPSQADNLPIKLPDLVIDSSKLEQSSHIKFLGVEIDNNLSWKFHIENLETKIARVIGIMYKVRPILNTYCLKSLYHSLIHSRLSYANIAWGSTNVSKLKKLISLQNHAIRIICNKRKHESIFSFSWSGAIRRFFIIKI